MKFVKRHEIVRAVLGISITAIGMIIILVATNFWSVLFKHSNLFVCLSTLSQDLCLLFAWARLRKVRTTQRNKRHEIVLAVLGGISVTAIGMIVIVLVASQFVSAPLWSLMVSYTVLVNSLPNLLLFAALPWLLKDLRRRQVRTTQRKRIYSA